MHNEITEVLQACHPIYINLHDKLDYYLTEEEKTLLTRFKNIWEEELCTKDGLLITSSISEDEIIFLGGYVYFNDLVKKN